MQFNLADLVDDNSVSDKIVSFHLSYDRTRLCVLEECDMYFEAHLPKATAQALVARLQALIDEMA